MQRFICFLTILLLATAAWAANPFAGTWKLNPSQSNYTTGAPPQAETIVVTDQGSTSQVSITGTAANGSTFSNNYTVANPPSGGTAQAGNGSNSVISKWDSANEREDTFMSNGQQVSWHQTTISSNGQTMTVTVKGLDEQGSEVAGTAVFNKQ